MVPRKIVVDYSCEPSFFIKRNNFFVAVVVVVDDDVAAFICARIVLPPKPLLYKHITQISLGLGPAYGVTGPEMEKLLFSK